MAGVGRDMSSNFGLGRSRLVASRNRVAVRCLIVDLAERYMVVGASACHVVKIASSRSRLGIGSVQ